MVQEKWKSDNSTRDGPWWACGFHVVATKAWQWSRQWWCAEVDSPQASSRACHQTAALTTWIESRWTWCSRTKESGTCADSYWFLLFCFDQFLTYHEEILIYLYIYDIYYIIWLYDIWLYGDVFKALAAQHQPLKIGNKDGPASPTRAECLVVEKCLASTRDIEKYAHVLYVHIYINTHIYIYIIQ